MEFPEMSGDPADLNRKARWRDEALVNRVVDHMQKGLAQRKASKKVHFDGVCSFDPDNCSEHYACCHLQVTCTLYRTCATLVGAAMSYYSVKWETSKSMRKQYHISFDTRNSNHNSIRIELPADFTFFRFAPTSPRMIIFDEIGGDAEKREESKYNIRIVACTNFHSFQKARCLQLRGV